MDDETPPKRVTRSRATARATIREPEVKIATAATKARVTRNTVSTTTKRKTRADDTLEETVNNENIGEDIMNAAPVKLKGTRARKKATQPEIGLQVEPEATNQGDSSALAPRPAKSTRGRPRRVIDEAAVDEPPKTTRGRPKRVAVNEVVTENLAEDVKKTTRGRVTAASKITVIRQSVDDTITEPLRKTSRGRPSTATRAVAAPKKNVKFQGPEVQDKENIISMENIKGKAKEVEIATGLRARPIRKPVSGSRTMRGRPKAADVANKLPLTPKKATQVSTAKDNVSEDELATMEKTPMRPLTKSPVKAPGTALGANRKLNFIATIPANRTATQGLGTSLMGSPARRPTPSPFKDSLKASPKRADMGNSMTLSSFRPSTLPPSTKNSTFKMPLFRSPARRPLSPTKICATSSLDGLNLGTTSKAAPFSISKFKDAPRTLNKSFSLLGRSPLFSPSKSPNEDATPHDISMNIPTATTFPGRLSCIFPRDTDLYLQDSEEIIDQSQDPCPRDHMIGDGESSAPQTSDVMAIDEVQRAINLKEQRSATPTNSPPMYSIVGFDLHAGQDLFENSDSEDELAFGSAKCSPASLTVFNVSTKDFAAPSTPMPAILARKLPRTAIIPRSTEDLVHNATRSQSIRASREQCISAPPIRPLNDWIPTTASSPHPFSMEEASYPGPPSGAGQGTRAEIQAASWLSPAKSSFFEDAISISDAVFEAENATVENDNVIEDLDAINFAPSVLDEEDIALVAEADEMSLISIQSDEDALECGEVLNQSTCEDKRSISEASQEYGDENAEPTDQNQAQIDPMLLATDARHSLTTSVSTAQKIFTPVRVFGERGREYHTVSKVPLKPAAEDSPLKVCKKSASASKMLAKRPVPLSLSFVVPQLPTFTSTAAVTPTRSNSWSTATTPVRTPRRDLDDQILRGAVVYVDVHTSEGADASAVFIELLVQMGAKCVKTWNWNPNNSNGSESDLSSQEGDREQAASVNGKIGITHVVFKDGGKRTLEKARESSGVVLCVGVGWVLDCERQNTWLPESPYAIDTAMIPRGGHRRRKSMEPRSIRNLNGTVSRLSSTSGTPRSVSAGYALSPTREFLNLPQTPGTGSRSARRKSTLWVLSPSPDGDGDKNGDAAGLLLSPVPATPAPETLSAYAELDDSSLDDVATPYYLKREQLVQRTCPPKRFAARETAISSAAFDAFGDAGSYPDVAELRDNYAGTSSGILMQRLLLARRKSLQWAPKVGSPLAKGGFKA